MGFDCRYELCIRLKHRVEFAPMPKRTGRGKPGEIRDIRKSAPECASLHSRKMYELHRQSNPKWREGYETPARHRTTPTGLKAPWKR